MKNILIFILLISSSQIYSQNVGIGNSSPAEKLDVNGNVNVTGTIKANGVSGQPNQVLSTNSVGNLAWSDLCDYKNFETLFSSQTWTVPAGVTSILVEGWGGGGGGNTGGGGGAGGYVKAHFIVTPSSGITVTVGTGGSAGSSGNSTQISYGATIIALGGSPGSTTGGGNGGIFQYGGGFVNFTGQTGESGNPTVYNSSYYSTTESREQFLHGDGGNSPFRNFTEGKGGNETFRRPANTLVFQYDGSAGKQPGGGGGGGSTIGSSYPGGSGFVTIYY
ncbi:MAG: hypothetical protein H0W12_00250 [Chitinophagaceae bacterium]|nr:hypothetical protein [Chitinophagaceae bacterium]